MLRNAAPPGQDRADDVLRAVRCVANGDTFVSPTLASFLLDSAGPSGTGLSRSGPLLVLSDREREILALLAAGQRDVDIARTLTISIRTVRSHLDRIRDKTGRRRRPELTRPAIELGVMPRSRPRFGAGVAVPVGKR
jgi:DNA-binding NarL/FixJ family response regulator